MWFEYNPGVPVLKGITFTAPAGSTTALVGSSGSGKSTLVSLVMAFNRPIKGTIRIDGHDLDDLKLASYRSHLGIVLQDNFLFDGTITENIRYGKPHASMDEVKEAARIAYCDEFVEEFADKYDTVVGERGVRLSGGQRQRVAIARAILADPRILILDEATSSLDSESEHKIQDALRTLRRGRTTFVIAHRLSTIRSADQILVLEAGEIVERGSHARAGARSAAATSSSTIASTPGSTIASSTRARIWPTRPGRRSRRSARSAETRRLRSRRVPLRSRAWRRRRRGRSRASDAGADGRPRAGRRATSAAAASRWILSPRSSRRSTRTTSSPSATPTGTSRAMRVRAGAGP